MKVAAVVISHDHREELAESLPALVPQVDEVVVIANTPSSAPLDALGARVIENARPASYAANINAGTRVDDRRARARLQPRCGARTWRGRRPPRVHGGAIPAAASQARSSWIPTAPGSPRDAASRPFAARSSAARPLRRLRPPLEHQRDHYLLDERPTEPVETDWMLGGCLLLRRAMLEELGGFDEGFRMYGEEIDLCYRAAKAGWERWYVPDAVVRHRWDAATDKSFFTKRTLWHWRGILRFVLKHPERLGAL